MMVKNVLGKKLEVCSLEPLTGFFRDGNCSHCESDSGQHTLCAEMTDEFLEFSKKKGNDLTTPRPEFNFQGLRQETVGAYVQVDGLSLPMREVHQQ